MVCAAPFDSFDESPMGVFMESPLGVRAGPSGGQILFWDETNLYNYNLGTETFEAPWAHGVRHLISEGKTVHLLHNWSQTLSDYSLVVFVVPESVPEWWSQVSTWTGRMYLAAQQARQTSFQGVWDVLLKGVTMGVVAAGFKGSSQGFYRFIDPHPITAGLTDETTSVWGGSSRGTSLTDIRQGENSLQLIRWINVASLGTSSPALLEETVDDGSRRVSFVLDAASFFTTGTRARLAFVSQAQALAEVEAYVDSVYEAPV